MNTSDSLFAGSLVKLKSGGPTMTVKRISSNSKDIECNWFDGATLHNDTFLKEELELVSLL